MTTHVKDRRKAYIACVTTSAVKAKAKAMAGKGVTLSNFVERLILAEAERRTG